MSNSSRPTSQQKSKETAVLYAAVADVLVVIPMFILGITTSSLTLLSEAVRVALMLVVEFYSYAILRAVHRDKLQRFRFGFGKLELFCNLAIGLTLVASGFWIAEHVIERVLIGEALSTPLGLAVAAIVTGVNALINALGLFAMFSAAQRDDSLVFRAQMRARRIKLIASLIVLATLTLAALVSDPIIALWLDALGGAFVAMVQISSGIRMISESVPDLLDHSIPAETRKQVDHLISGIYPRPTGLRGLRTRRAGRNAHIELSLASESHGSVLDFCSHCEKLQTVLEAGLDDIEVTINFHGSEVKRGSQ